MLLALLPLVGAMMTGLCTGQADWRKRCCPS